MNDEQEKKTFEKYLPDFSSRAVNMEEASKQLKEALDKIAQAFGHDPKSEVYSSDYRDHGGRLGWYFSWLRGLPSIRLGSELFFRSIS
jgi:hypothetical protein